MEEKGKKKFLPLPFETRETIFVLIITNNPKIV